MLRLAVRTDGQLAKVKEYIASKGYSGFGVKEIAGTNEHYHWYLQTDVSRVKNVQAFRVDITRKIPELKGNGSYSAKECGEDYERYWQYMCKGAADGAGVDVVWRHGLVFTDEKLEELHQAYWSENNARAAKKQKLPAIVDTVVEKLKADGTAWRDREAITRVYIRALYDREKPINIFSVKSAVNLVQIKLAPVAEEAIEYLASYCCNV